VADANTVQALLDQPLDPAAWETLARRDGETAKAHAAFLEYVRMGPGRSLRKLHARYVDLTALVWAPTAVALVALVVLFTSQALVLAG